MRDSNNEDIFIYLPLDTAKDLPTLIIHSNLYLLIIFTNKIFKIQGLSFAF